MFADAASYHAAVLADIELTSNAVQHYIDMCEQDNVSPKKEVIGEMHLDGLKKFKRVSYLFGSNEPKEKDFIE